MARILPLFPKETIFLEKSSEICSEIHLDVPVCLDIMQVSDMDTKIYLEIHLYVCEGVWTLCKNLVDPDLHASTTSEHTVGTLCPYMQTDEIPSLRN